MFYPNYKYNLLATHVRTADLFLLFASVQLKRSLTRYKKKKKNTSAQRGFDERGPINSDWFIVLFTSDVIGQSCNTSFIRKRNIPLTSYTKASLRNL